jgi:hypothetical protein
LKELCEKKGRLDRLGERGASPLAVNEQRAKITELERLLESARADRDAENTAESRLLQLKSSLDEIESEIEWLHLVANAREILDALDQAIVRAKNHDSTLPASQYAQRSAKLRVEVGQLIDARLEPDLRKKSEEIEVVAREVICLLPEFWVGAFEYAKARRHEMSDAARAERFINQGDSCIRSGNIEQLKLVVRELLFYLLEPSRRQVDYVRRLFDKMPVGKVACNDPALPVSPSNTDEESVPLPECRAWSDVTDKPRNRS